MDTSELRIPALRPPGRRADGLTVDFPEFPPLAPMTAWKTVALRLVAFAVVFVLATLVLGAPSLAFASTPDLALAVQALAVSVGAVIAYLVVARFLERRHPVELAWSRALALPLGLALGVVLLSACVGVIALLGGLEFTGTQLPRGLVVVFAVAGVQAGVVEEILSRGIVFRYAEELLGTWAAVVLSASLFGMLHLGSPNATLWSAIAITIEAGVLFSALYLLTRNLWLRLRSPHGDHSHRPVRESPFERQAPLLACWHG